MNEDTFNMEIRKYLKQVGITSQLIPGVLESTMKRVSKKECGCGRT
jgi:hypothetical protein